MAGLRTQPPLLIAYAIGAPLVHAGIALGLTFPFNILLGIPLYVSVAQRVIGS
jgi:hypothetical protein